MSEPEPHRTTVTFLGTDAVVPTCGGDTASFVINRTLLVDTGWYAVLRMGCFGLDPLELEYLILTHGHHDHYLGLPHLLFYSAMRAHERPDRKPLKIVGPAEHLERIVELAGQFLQMERFAPVRFTPTLIPMKAGAILEDPAFTLATCASVHPVPGLCYRFEDAHSGRVLAFTGDTAYAPHIVSHVAGANLLIHEASYGARAAPPQNSSLHSGAPDAARVATEAHVDRLALVHCPRPRQAEALEAAQALFPAVFWPADGETVTV